MAMLADASDQVLLLVRQHDVDVPDPAQCSSFVQGFILEGTRMWLEGHCWGVGCTRVMLRFLSKPRTYLVAGGASFNGATTIGGACTDAVRERCLARMGAGLDLPWKCVMPRGHFSMSCKPSRCSTWTTNRTHSGMGSAKPPAVRSHWNVWPNSSAASQQLCSTSTPDTSLLRKQHPIVSVTWGVGAMLSPRACKRHSNGAVMTCEWR